MIAELQLVSAELMEEWVNDFDAWDVCDQVCWNLFDKTPYACQKDTERCQQEKEFVRRAGFVLMAELAVHDKQVQDGAFVQFFPLIKRYADDERKLVNKAVNWALRQIGKRNGHLRALALECAYEIHDMDSKTARWMARDALKELQSKEIKN
jgi:3-methyladenine DNA glycosylase AlkD